MSNSEALKDWSRRVRHALVDHDESAADMARAIGYTPQYISQTMSGKQPRQCVVDLISYYLDIEPITLES